MPLPGGLKTNAFWTLRLSANATASEIHKAARQDFRVWCSA
jgi:hypothetical protein